MKVICSSSHFNVPVNFYSFVVLLFQGEAGSGEAWGGGGREGCLKGTLGASWVPFKALLSAKRFLIIPNSNMSFMLKTQVRPILLSELGIVPAHVG